MRSACFLVAEDEAPIAKSLAHFVRPFGESVIVPSVAKARSLLHAVPRWAGWIIDIGLTDGCGLDVLTQYRAAFPLVPALVLTGSGERECVNAAYDLGADYLIKPADEAQVVRFLEKATNAYLASLPAQTAAGSPLEASIAEVRDLMARSQQTRARYRVGCVIVGLMDDPARYGTHAVNMVAEALGEDPSTMYRYAPVARCWNLAEFEVLVSRRGPKGSALTWSHLVAVAPVSSPSERASLLDRALVEGLSVRAFVALADQYQ